MNNLAITDSYLLIVDDIGEKSDDGLDISLIQGMN